MTKKIAILDDSFALCLLVKEILDVKNYSVDMYQRADDLLLRRDLLPGYDLLILDLNLPEMDGFKVMEKLKKIMSTDMPPVVFLTGQSTKETVDHAIKFGAIDFIAKPIDPDLFLNRICGVLEHKDSTSIE